MNVKSNLKHFDFAGARVLILGAGGSALAVTDEILRQGAAKVTVANRSIARAQAFEAQFGSKVTAAALQDVASAAGACDLLVNTTPLGMQGQAPLTFDFSTLHPKAAVADIVYTPLITDFLRVASTRGFPIVTGLGMLLHQAVKGFELWFGVRPNVTKELHDLIARDIDADYQK
jgi:shikimate dehydrogenase